MGKTHRFFSFSIKKKIIANMLYQVRIHSSICASKCSFSQQDSSTVEQEKKISFPRH